MQWMLGMFRAPNQWRESDGKFTATGRRLSIRKPSRCSRSFWDAGYVHPDTPTYIQQQGAQPFYAGKFAMYPTNFFAFGIAWDRLLGINKTFRLARCDWVRRRKGVQFQDWGGNQITVLKKGSPERVRQVLGVLNYLAAPFGSPEYLNLGTASGHRLHVRRAGQSCVYADGSEQRAVHRLADHRQPASRAVRRRRPELRERRRIRIETAAHELAITDPSVGLYSPTNATKGANLTQAMTDGVNQILFGRADCRIHSTVGEAGAPTAETPFAPELESEFAKATRVMPRIPPCLESSHSRSSRFGVGALAPPRRSPPTIASGSGSLRSANSATPACPASCRRGLRLLGFTRSNWMPSPPQPGHTSSVSKILARPPDIQGTGPPH